MTVCRISLLMKTWGKIRAKEFVSSESVSDAVTPIIGSLLMLIVLVALAGVAVISFSNIANEGESTQPLMARISLESCEGGLPYSVEGQNAAFKNNKIVLINKGGTPLPLDTISIKIFGYGQSHMHGFKPYPTGFLTGNISILYLDLSPGGKNDEYYADKNKVTLEDGSWNVGERLVLCGQDSEIGATKSSVKVSVDGDSNTSDNYGFKAGSEITLKIIDTKSKNVIAEQRAIVKHYEG
ncbi:MAG: type IV pilin N-terminal domain-containing protein [Methanosarcina vacuolata]|nr:type IV pilin N-terminal domain-containing protein [Methanosarcina vacuolata]